MDGRDKGEEVAGSTSPGMTPSWLREGFTMPVTQNGFSLGCPKIGRFLGDGVMNRCIDTDKLKWIASMGVNDALGYFGTHFAQVLF